METLISSVKGTMYTLGVKIKTETWPLLYGGLYLAAIYVQIVTNIYCHDFIVKFAALFTILSKIRIFDVSHKLKKACKLQRRLFLITCWRVAMEEKHSSIHLVWTEIISECNMAPFVFCPCWCDIVPLIFNFQQILVWEHYE